MISRRGYSNYTCHYPSRFPDLKTRSCNKLMQRIEPQGAKILMIFPVPIEQTLKNR